MAKFDAVIDRQSMGSAGIIDGRHPAVVKVLEFRADNGTVEAGEILAFGADGLIDFYDSEAVSANATLAVPTGINLFDVDTEKDSLGSVVLHGTVIRSALKNMGEKAEDADVQALEENTLIWAF
jgi:hypothetical protein